MLFYLGAVSGAAMKRQTEKSKYLYTAGWSSPVARRAHNPKVAGPNPAPATKKRERLQGYRLEAVFDVLPLPYPYRDFLLKFTTFASFFSTSLACCSTGFTVKRSASFSMDCFFRSSDTWEYRNIYSFNTIHFATLPCGMDYKPQWGGNISTL